LYFLDRFPYKFLISNFMEILPVETELVHADRRPDGQTNVTKLISA